MPINGDRLFKLFEQAMNNKGDDPSRPYRGLTGYRRQLHDLLGITEGPGGEQRLDPAARAIHANDFSVGEVMHAFLPRRFAPQDLARALSAVQARRGDQAMQLAEAEGHVVLPSHFAHISAFSDTIGGLIEAWALESYQNPVFVGDQLFEEKESRMNGGKAIGVMNDGRAGDNLIDGEPYPTVGLKETAVDIPDNKRRGNVIQINEKDFIYDRTETVREKAETAGEAVRRLKEVDQAKVFLGITNNYSRDGVANNTYLDAAGDLPNNYVNSQVNELVNFLSVDTAIQLFGGNTDPGTGFEIELAEPYQIAVMPQNYANAMTVAKAVTIERRTATSTEIVTTENPLAAIEPIKLTRLWFNLLVAAGVSAANAAARWFVGDFKRAFKYRVIIPYENREAPLSSEDVRRDIILVRVAREHGVAFVAEPRWTSQQTKEDVTP